MITYKSGSNIKPQTWQVEKTCVYHNYNIIEVEKEDFDGKHKEFKYDVDEYSVDEYVKLHLDKNSSMIEYVAMMSDIDLPEE